MDRQGWSIETFLPLLEMVCCWHLGAREHNTPSGSNRIHVSKGQGEKWRNISTCSWTYNLCLWCVNVHVSFFLLLSFAVSILYIYILDAKMTSVVFWSLYMLLAFHHCENNNTTNTTERNKASPFDDTFTAVAEMCFERAIWLATLISFRKTISEVPLFFRDLGTISLPPSLKAAAYLFIYIWSRKHDGAKSARWIWGFHLLSVPLFLSCINSSSGESERSACQVLSPEEN